MTTVMVLQTGLRFGEYYCCVRSAINDGGPVHSTESDIFRGGTRSLRFTPRTLGQTPHSHLPMASRRPTQQGLVLSADHQTQIGRVATQRAHGTPALPLVQQPLIASPCQCLDSVRYKNFWLVPNPLQRIVSCPNRGVKPDDLAL